MVYRQSFGSPLSNILILNGKEWGKIFKECMEGLNHIVLFLKFWMILIFLQFLVVFLQCGESDFGELLIANSFMFITPLPSIVSVQALWLTQNIWTWLHAFLYKAMSGRQDIKSLKHRNSHTQLVRMFAKQTFSSHLGTCLFSNAYWNQAHIYLWPSSSTPEYISSKKWSWTLKDLYKNVAREGEG